MTRHDLAGRAALIGWLTVMWLLLWGTVSVPNVVDGVLIGTVLVSVIAPPPLRDDPFRVHPWPALSLLVWFSWALVVSNVSVAKEVLAPTARSGIRPAIVAVQLRTRSGRLATIIANAITLTPGTLTVDARGRPAVLFVHVLSFADEDSVRADVDDLERRVVDAFGTAEERAVICGAARTGSIRAADLGGGAMIQVALALIAVGGAGFLARLITGPNLSDRVVALDGLLTIVVIAMMAWSAYTGRPTFLIVGVVVALVSFLGTSIFARFIEGRRS